MTENNKDRFKSKILNRIFEGIFLMLDDIFYWWYKKKEKNESSKRN